MDAVACHFGIALSQASARGPIVRRTSSSMNETMRVVVHVRRSLARSSEHTVCRSTDAASPVKDASSVGIQGIDAVLAADRLSDRPHDMPPSAAPDSVESRAAFAAFIATKGSLRGSEAVLCALHWLGGDSDGGVVHSTEVRALYPRHHGRRLGSAAQPLRHLSDRGLAEAVGDGRYRITSLGRLVVELLPDRAAIGQLRGLRSAAPAPQRFLSDRP